MILKPSCQIAEHGIDLRGQRHQISRTSRRDLIEAPIEIVERYVHVQRGAHIQANRQSMEFSHHDVFQAATHELLFAAEDFWTNESRYIIDMYPSVRRLASLHACRSNRFRQRPGESVFARLMDQHVHAMTVTIRKVRSLTRFKIKPKRASSRLGMSDHLLNRDIKRDVG